MTVKKIKGVYMWIKTIFLALCLPAFFLSSSPIDKSAYYSRRERPLWIKPCDFALTPIPVKPSQTNLQFLLIDSQKNWEEKTFYFHYAIISPK
jgi:hypothetical protein